MPQTAIATPMPHHPECRCRFCQLHRSSKPYTEATRVYDFMVLDDTPGGGERPGDARYRPRQPLLVLVAAIIGRTRQSSKNIFRINVFGVDAGTIEVPASLSPDDDLHLS